MTKKMYKAYQAAERILKEQMQEDESELLREADESGVVVVKGCYDHVETVLDILSLKYALIEESEVAALNLVPDQLLIVNCPGKIGSRGVKAVRAFVEKGGSLFTTDWALKHVLEPAFPGLVEYNDKPTADAVVRIEIREHDNPFLDGVFHKGSDPQWWLEGSSYPIRILDQEKVTVLIGSKELEQKWGEAPIAVSFSYGEGEVFHMISHYYLQRTETRTQRHEAGGNLYAMECGAGKVLEADRALYEEVSTGEVESAHTSLKMFTNVLKEKQRRVREKNKPGS